MRISELCKEFSINICLPSAKWNLPD